jgi:hypothetical protein
MTESMPQPLSVGEETAQREFVVEEELKYLHARPREFPFRFLPQDAHRAGSSYRLLEGRLELAVRPISDDGLRLTVRIENLTALNAPNWTNREEALSLSLISTHTILSLGQGEFFSLCDPPGALCEAAAACYNCGTWPVLVGDERRRDTMLSAPIILYDYPRIAPESPGDFFDATEMDELLTLRILTLTEEEKREARAANGQARALLDRTERLTPEQLVRMHGAVRGVAPHGLRPGARVLLRPRGRSDALDLILSGKTATIVSVEQDYEGQVHLAVTVDEDPGKDLGEQGRAGHRFFFRPEEVELLTDEERKGP